MQDKRIGLQVKILTGLIGLNFLAQVPYFLYLYYPSQPLLTDLRSIAIMAVVFLPFLVGSIQLFRRKPSGYWLMIAFSSAEFLFYLWNGIGAVLHGSGLFFQVRNPNPVLRLIYSIGYLNLFASGYFLILLLVKRGHFLGKK